MRKALIVFGLLVAVVAAAVFWTFSSAGEALHEAIETVGSEALGAPVRLGAIDVDLIAGRIVLSDLEVANPPGYGDGAAIIAPTVEIAMAPVAGDSVVLIARQIRIASAAVVFVESGGASNLDRLHANAVGYADSMAEAAATAPGEAVVIIEDLSVEAPRLTIRKADRGPAEQRLGDIRLSALGGPDGVPPPALVPPVLAAVAEAARLAAAAEN